ncbi:hypothetical protein Nepgr_026184 [Nepenthes gracilis]|uniref:Uncharacterized protein n=1 Tax=Nepenthes gracilis TaxID=150966 RepID=A0AAD3T860_NEPGR|nr:hypothetical protein Nepgr_026184 [Nepenthes gracilis]
MGQERWVPRVWLMPEGVGTSRLRWPSAYWQPGDGGWRQRGRSEGTGYIASKSKAVATRAFSHLLAFLRHRYPKIRKAAVEQVYLVLLQNAHLMAEDRTGKAIEIVSEMCWEGEVEEANQRRLQLYELGGASIGAGALLEKSSGVLTKDVETRRTDADENAFYSSLVESSEF